MNGDRYVVDPSARALLADLGLVPADVLRHAGLAPDVFSHSPIALTPDEYHALWTAMDDLWHGDDLPIAIARALRVEVFQPPIFAALCSPDLEVAADRIAAHKRLIGPLRVHVDAWSGGLDIAPQWPGGITAPRAFVLTELLFWVAVARMGTRTAVAPLRVTMPTPPAQQEAYVDYLGGVGIADGPRPQITFAHSDATRPFLTADDRLWAFFEPALRRSLTELDAQASTADRVRDALLELLPSGRSTITTVARHLAVSARTLQRRLHDEDTTYQALLDQTRESLARHYLSQPDMPAAQIAFLLGYSDTNSFYRAFHTWTGATPQAVRTAAAASG